MPIIIPDHPRLAQRAADAGFSTPRDYVLHLVEMNAGPFEAEANEEVSEAQNTTPNDEEIAERLKRFREMMEHIRALDIRVSTFVDCSRDSIYYDPEEL